MRYVPNVRGVWDQCKKKCILTTNRPSTDQWPTTSHLGKFQVAISPQGVIRSTSWLVLQWGFRVQQIEWRYFRFDQIQDGGREPPSWKIHMAISSRWIVRFTLSLVLGWGFWGRRIEWRYFQFDQIQDNSNGDISATHHPIYSVFGPRVGFSGSLADRVVQFRVGPNSMSVWEKTMWEE